jgi:uncharacterized oligopeptide transporter (OPT) family protein
MWRSLFLACGIMLVIVGVECLIIDSATLYGAAESSAADLVDPNRQTVRTTRVWRPSEWMPWSLIGGGAVVVLYAITLPKRWGAAA